MVDLYQITKEICKAGRRDILYRRCIEGEVLAGSDIKKHDAEQWAERQAEGSWAVVRAA